MATDPTSQARPPKSVIESIAKVVANVRGNVHAVIGDNPYRVFRCVRSWSGGAPGRGQDTVTRIELGCGRANGKITPPKVTLAGSYARALQGLVPDGTALVEQIDGSLTEAQIVDFGRLEPGDESYFEIVQDGRNGGGADLPVGRYTLLRQPVRPKAGYDWTLALKAQEPSATFANAQLGPDGGTDA